MHRIQYQPVSDGIIRNACSKTWSVWVMVFVHCILCTWFAIAHIGSMSFQTSLPHRPLQVRCTLQRWLSVYQHKLLPRGHHRDNWRKPRMKIKFQLNIYPTKPIQVSNINYIFWRLICVLVKMGVGTGAPRQRKRYSRDKTKIIRK